MEASLKVKEQQTATQVIFDHGPTNTLRTCELDRLTELVHEYGQTTKTRCLIFTSEKSGVFSYGLDPQFVLQQDDAGRLAVFQALARLVQAVLESSIPIIADVNGPAIAGGAVLAALGDFVLIDGKVGKVCFSESKVRLPVPRFVQCLIERKVSYGRALEMALLGKNIDAALACAWGFAQDSYQSSEERQQLVASYVGRINRIDAEVLGETLKEAKRPYLVEVKGFRSNPEPFARFVSDDFLGRGLRELQS